MSKKKKKVQKLRRKNSSVGIQIDQKTFMSDLDLHIRKVFQIMVVPLEQRMDTLFERIQNVKSNVVVSNTLLEQKNIFKREEFYEEFKRIEQEDRVKIDGSGKMEGVPHFSLYNIGE